MAQLARKVVCWRAFRHRCYNRAVCITHWVFLSLVSGLCLLQAVTVQASLAEADPPLIPQPSSLPLEASVLASAYHYDAESNTLRAEGEVEAFFTDLTLRCAALVLNLSQQSLQAEGQVDLTGPGFHLKGRELRYEVPLRSGSLVDAVGEVAGVSAGGEKAPSPPLRLTAPKVLVEDGGLTLSQGRFTFCNAEKPHFWLEARELAILPGQSATLSSGRLWLYGHKLAHFPQYALSFRERGTLPVPIVGYNKGWGAFAGFEAPLLKGRAEVALGSKGGVVGKWVASGSVGARHAVPLQWEAAIARREDAKYPYDSRLLLNLAPSLSLATAQGRVGSFEATWGRITELPTEVRRDKTGLNWLGPEMSTRLGGGSRSGSSRILGLTVRPRAWHNWYSEGEKYGVFAVEAKAKAEVGPGKSLSVAYLHNIVTGATPFTYDSVHVKRELDPGAEWRLGRKWAVEVGARYDLDEKTFVDNAVTVEAIQHCLTYSLEWREARRQLSFSVGLSGAN